MDASRSDLRSAVLEAARRTGVENVDLSSEHARWEVYLRAMDSPAEWDLLREIVGLEPDPSVATSVVLRMLERVPDAERLAWAERLAVEGKRALAVLRVRELRILEADSPAGDEVAEWSDWLQRAAAEKSASVRVLESLSRSGRTKRVRNLSAERLRALRRAS
ncbi:hypothetical protein ACH5A7_34285 [Streptomyces sp. NPDC018955]|uniref:hypothetical protein n=1 Tax=Streptomyces sp. NPDC018955 TaxID=3365055 RepID=UPI00379EC817